MRVTGHLETATIRTRLAALRTAARWRAEVFLADARSAELATYHAHGARLHHGGQLPPRNPFFLQPSDADRIQRLLKLGIASIVKGDSSDLRTTMAAVGDLAARAMRRNIAPDGRLAAAHVGLHGRAVLDEGDRMAPLSRDYAETKKRRFGSRPVLVATGQMRDAIRSRVVQK